jgi:O-methyltransferase involved in polyketide biosynthesis
MSRMQAEKVRLSKEKETYLATLYGKAMDAAVENPILGDRFAADAVARIDYDFKALKLPNGGEITLPMYGVMGRLPFYRNLIRHLRYEFSADPAAKAAP